MYPEFDALGTTAGLEITDPIESRRFTLSTTGQVTPTQTEADEFVFPVDSACAIRTAGLTLPYTVPVTVRALDGTYQDTLSPPTSREFPEGEYLVELDAPIKVYVRVDSPLTVVVDTDTAQLAFDGETSVRIGARSYHRSPAGTITVPDDDPQALMEAVSTFSSALKTTSPERSWPTLRGHPPRLEFGDELSIPDGLDAPDTGITIEVPPEYGPIYAVAPLAYYLGADVVAGDTPMLETESGVTHYLGTDATSVSETAGELLKRTLLLDCVTRTEGYYSIDLHERNVLEPQVALDFASLYTATPSERLTAYLSVPDEAMASIVPSWHQVTHVEPEPESATLLPYVVDDLSVVRIDSPDDTGWVDADHQRTAERAIDSFLRRATASEEVVRSANTRSRASNDREIDDPERGIPGIGEYVPLPEVDALEQSYVGDKTPERGAKLLPEAFENDVPEPTDGGVEITVVCNDAEMRAEWDSVSEIYGERDDVSVDVDCRFDVSTHELRDLLGRDRDVFHFIGHIDGLGFECRDGILDATTVESTGATTVLLNGCRSHDQGIALVEAGANAAIVSLGDVGNVGAIEVGETLARLLRHGFSVGSAMQIVREYTTIGRDYLVVGDPGVAIVQLESGVPLLYRVLEYDESNAGESDLTVEPVAYSSGVCAAGSLFVSYLPGLESKHVAVGACGQTTVQSNTFLDAFAGDSVPLLYDGDLAWTDEFFDD